MLFVITLSLDDLYQYQAGIAGKGRCMDEGILRSKVVEGVDYREHSPIGLMMQFSALNKELSNSSSLLTPTGKKNKPTQEAQVCNPCMRL